MPHRSVARSAPILLPSLLLSLALLVAACGSDDPDVTAAPGSSSPSPDGTAPPDEAAFPVSVTGDNGEVTIEAQPERIVSLSPTATEMLFAIEADEAVVAVDEVSNFPPVAPVTDLSGYTPNLEAVAAYDPDLVVVSTDSGDVVAGLAALGIPVVQLDAVEDLDGTYRQLEVLGAATGHVGDAAEVVAEMQSDIDELIAMVPDRETPLTYYHELDDLLFSVTSSTFIGEIYALAGLENIADATAAAGDDYPQLASEYVIAQDPDLIFLADTRCCGQSADTLMARPGWDQLGAVRDGGVHELDDDVASRWGPRVVEFLGIVVDATTTVAAE